MYSLFLLIWNFWLICYDSDATIKSKSKSWKSRIFPFQAKLPWNSSRAPVSNDLQINCFYPLNTFEKAKYKIIVTEIRIPFSFCFTSSHSLFPQLNIAIFILHRYILKSIQNNLLANWTPLYTVLVKRVRYFVLLNYSYKSCQLSKPGTDLKSAGPDIFKTPPTCSIWPSFGWDIWG